MGALLILFLMAGYLWLVYQITRRVPRWAKPLVVIAAVLVVSADGYLGRKKLEQLCEEQGGLHIYETVNNVEGFEIEDSKLWMLETNNAYRYIEELRNAETGKVNRALMKNGKVYVEKNVEPKSRYLVKINAPISKFDYYKITANLIIDKHNGHVLADTVYIYYRGGWFNRFIGSLYGGSPFSYGCSQAKNADSFKQIKNKNLFEQVVFLIASTLKINETGEKK